VPVDGIATMSKPSSGEPGDARLLLRFALGSAYLARRQLFGALRAHAPAAGADQPPAPSVEAPRLRATVRAARRSLAWLGQTWPFTVAARAAAERRAAVGRRVGDWRAFLGAEEEVGVPLARATLGHLVDEAIGTLGDSSSLHGVIEEQSANLGQDALDRLRTTTATADARLDALLRRLRRR